MNIRVRVRPEALLVRARGDLTESAAAELLEQVRKELEPQPRNVVLDLSQIESMAAGALPYVFRIQGQTDQNHRMIVSGTSEPVRRLLERTNVVEALEVAASEEDAFRSVATTV
jgi:anti-anti-sigma factor